jgi:hypothetical protein
MAIYDYSSGGFPSSPVTDDILAMKGTTYKYNGSAWEVKPVGTTSFTYTATSGQTAFTGSDTGSKTLTYTVASIHVFLNGILLDAADYTATDGTTITLAIGATTGDTMQVVAYGVLVSAGGGGAMELINSNVITSNTALIEVTGITGYTRHQLQMSYIRATHDSFPKLYLGTSAGYASSYYKGTASGQASIQGAQSGENGYVIYDITNLTIAQPTLLLQKAVVRSIANNAMSGIHENTFAEVTSTVFDRIKMTSGFQFQAGTTFSLYGFKG